MQKLAAMLILLRMLSNRSHARCINSKHRRLKTGEDTEICDYSCQVRPDHIRSFDDGGNCNNCGCNRGDHVTLSSFLNPNS